MWQTYYRLYEKLISIWNSSSMLKQFTQSERVFLPIVNAFIETAVGDPED